MMHRRGKDSGEQGLRVRRGFQSTKPGPLPTFPFSTYKQPHPDSSRFEYLPQIRRAASAWPYPLKKEGKKVVTAGQILTDAKAFLDGRFSSISRRLPEKDLLELQRRTNELDRAFSNDASPETLERLGSAILVLMPEIKR